MKDETACQVIRGIDLPLIPASHEDVNDPGVLKKVLFTHESLADGRVQMINWSVLKNGRSFSRHYHEKMEEIFVVFAGEATILIGDTPSLVVRTGDAIRIPAGMPHKMRASDAGDVSYLAIGILTGNDGRTVVIE